MSQALPLPLIDGRYQVTRVLGQGGSARTFACEDLAEGRRPVAVKELRIHGLEDWKPVELFEREARVLAGLRHPGIPEIHRHFEARDAAGAVGLYLVMELVDGLSMLEHLRAGRSFSEVEVVELAIALLDILDYIHDRRPPVFHRDIKPSNVVLRGGGTPVLVDFNAVADGLRPAEGGTTVTGTFGYMPPEQLVGRVSPATDLYALGATLLHVLTGRAPGEVHDDTGRLRLPAEVPARPTLRRAIDAMLAPAPRDRPASARAARRVLLGLDEPAALMAAGRTSLVAAGGTALAPAVRHTKLEGPVPVEVGPPPRDPKGPLRAVYRNLVDLWDGRMTERRMNPTVWRRIGIGTVHALFGISSLGIVHGIFALSRRSRHKKYEGLFRDGIATSGQVVSASLQASQFTGIIYEYDVDGRRHRGRMDLAGSIVAHIAPGDEVTVLFDAAAPDRSCVVYRWLEQEEVVALTA